VSEDSEIVHLDVDGQRIEGRRGRPLLNELLNAGLVVSTACGGQGICHLCRVVIVDATGLPPANAVEKRALGNVRIATGMRLSCQIVVDQPCSIQLPEQTRGGKRNGGGRRDARRGQR
jgi:Na+-transporting NADH:ubiquinone oxidoreductase subunit F